MPPSLVLGLLASGLGLVALAFFLPRYIAYQAAKDVAEREEEAIKRLPQDIERWLARHTYVENPAKALSEPSLDLDPNRLRTSGYEPPYVRFRCPKCGSEKDGWVNEDGTLEDWRDAMCLRNEQAPCFQTPMKVVDDD